MEENVGIIADNPNYTKPDDMNTTNRTHFLRAPETQDNFPKEVNLDLEEGKDSRITHFRRTQNFDKQEKPIHIHDENNDDEDMEFARPRILPTNQGKPSGALSLTQSESEDELKDMTSNSKLQDDTSRNNWQH